MVDAANTARSFNDVSNIYIGPKERLQSALEDIDVGIANCGDDLEKKASLMEIRRKLSAANIDLAEFIARSQRSALVQGGFIALRCAALDFVPSP